MSSADRGSAGTDARAASRMRALLLSWLQVVEPGPPDAAALDHVHAVDCRRAGKIRPRRRCTSEILRILVEVDRFPPAKRRRPLHAS